MIFNEFETILNRFGLNPDEIKVYLNLLERGKESVVEISRNLELPRTKVYRILDNLIKLELVINEYDEYGFKFVAAGLDQLDLLISRKENDLTSLKNEIPKLKEALFKKMGIGQDRSRVIYYKGVKGLTQVNFNIIKANQELLSYEVSNAEAYMTHDDAEEMRKEMLAKKIMIRTISNVTYMEKFTNVTGMVKNYWEIRYIDPKILTIKADVFIYNNVYAMCHYLKNHDVFCVETINDELTRMQKQLFEALWSQAKPLKKLDNYGTVKLVG